MRYFITGLILSFGFLSLPTLAASTYAAPAMRAGMWLENTQNLDGSWGSREDLKYAQTSEVIQALAALDRRSFWYYTGLTWLENHAASNSDFLGRRIVSLSQNGNSVSADIQSLQSTRSASGWGLSGAYQGSALDTALSLQALEQAGFGTTDPGVASAVTFLKAAQLTGLDKGWVIGGEIVSDPITTAEVLRALIPLQATDIALPAIVSNGLATLNARVGSTSPVIQQALAALADLSSSTATAQGVALLNNLLASQGVVDGSWGGDPYATALAARALAAGMGSDLAAQKQVVNIPDPNLRAAINQALGRNILDALNAGEMAQLTTLTASNRNITNLAGLQYAVNLTFLDLRNNNINSFAPVAGLAGSAKILEAGNPGYTGVQLANSTDNDVPTLPQWGAILMGGLLLLSMGYFERRRR